MTEPRKGTLTERVTRLEARDESDRDQFKALRDSIDRLEARLWWLVTSGAGVGAATGAAGTLAAIKFLGGS